MNTISLFELRRDAAHVARRIQAGERLVLTHRGKPVARLESVSRETIEPDDAFYQLDGLADANGCSLSNQEIDHILYGR
ncbi:MAG: type II toxin-antitoxin system prevent-host-death family antitoxin [Candidatus Competibacteraceae bacterium]|nr:type II toxin-antitoxin system prevent-host-death family antitoxin [Candidatus Competibacteraceae bacterium]